MVSQTPGSFPNPDRIPVTPSERSGQHGVVDQATGSPLSAPHVDEASPAPADTASARERLRAGWAATRAALGSLLGLAPHVLHHVGLVAGTALLAGAWGNLALYLVGMLLSIPMLRRLHRRFGSIAAPAVGAAIFTVMFLLSAFVLGPTINPAPTSPASPTASQSPDAGSSHDGHHR